MDATAALVKANQRILWENISRFRLTVENARVKRD